MRDGRKPPGREPVEAVFGHFPAPGPRASRGRRRVLPDDTGPVHAVWQARALQLRPYSRPAIRPARTGANMESITIATGAAIVIVLLVAVILVLRRNQKDLDELRRRQTQEDTKTVLGDEE